MLDGMDPAAREASDPAEGNKDRLYVGSIEKGIRVLQAFSHARGDLSLSEIAQLSGLGKSAVQRFCHTFVTLGYLAKDPRSRRLSPSPRLLEFSFMYLHADPFIQVASTYLLQMHEDCHEAANLALRLDSDVIYVVRLPSLSARLTNPLVGGRAPLFCTASGRALLSTLTQAEVVAVLEASSPRALTPMTLTERDQILEQVAAVRRDGFTIANQECLVGEIAVAAPVLGKDRRAVAAINICTTTPKWSVDSVREKLAPMVCHTAREISRAIGLSASA